MTTSRAFSVSIGMSDQVDAEFNAFRQSLRTRLVKEALTRTAKNVVLPAFAAKIGRGKKPAVRKDGRPRPRLADSLAVRVRRFKDKTGYYAVTGPNDSQPHAWIYEHGTVLRFRERIGGKFKYLEPIPSIFKDFGNEVRDIKRARRTTGWGPPANIVPQVKAQVQGMATSYFANILASKIVKKAERQAAGGA